MQCVSRVCWRRHCARGCPDYREQSAAGSSCHVGAPGACTQDRALKKPAGCARAFGSVRMFGRTALQSD
eukprot:10140817-Alexandrium_andersonii.AAC.1